MKILRDRKELDMRTVRTINNEVLINTSWTELNGYRELIADVYYYNYSEGRYEFTCHHQKPVARRSVYERKLIQSALRDYLHGYTDDNGTPINYNEYKELEYLSGLEE